MDDGRGELGVLLRSWRDRLAPTDVGLHDSGSRRAVGLRREELAALAGLSVDYVVRLEQGRATRPSAQVAASLARALQLSVAERDHLFMMAGLLPPSAGEVPTHIPPGVQRLIARLGDLPLAVFTASWDLVTWSQLWGAVHGEPELPFNLLRARFAPSEQYRPRAVGGAGSPEDEAFEVSLVADLRRVHGRYPEDRRLNALVAELSDSSERFAALWSSGVVGEHQSERKIVRSALAGEFEVDCDVFSVTGTDLRIVVYTAAAGSDAAERLDFLRIAAINAMR
ncbi:helix-turn-helix transcriptional regulator [Agromyces sp. NPDC058110]|uniref:helix-turn-helix transcriptional regulator n=1 Tax=Agromyces sp. NPDC058110 TaxID=3346345 RepID=UPI0036DA2290